MPRRTLITVGIVTSAVVAGCIGWAFEQATRPIQWAGRLTDDPKVKR